MTFRRRPAAWAALFLTTSLVAVSGFHSSVLRAEGAPAPRDEVPGAYSEYSLSPLPNGLRLLRILSPTVLELTAVVAGSEKAPPDGPMPPVPVPEFTVGDFTVTVDGKKVEVKEVGFRRRVVYAPLKQRDLRIGNFVTLRLAAPISDNQTVEVSATAEAGKKTAWLEKTRATAKAEPLRYSPVIHVNQVGYAPEAAKVAIFGYFLGTLRELEVPDATKFHVIEAKSGKAVHEGTLKLRADRGMPQPWYRKVYEADFSALRTPGEYRLTVAGHGASYPFLINDGVSATFARTYALGFYHQRCGAENALPFTRCTHAACHLAPAEVPTGPVRKLQGFPEDPPDAHLYPYARAGKVDVSGGHHDAGDYSKYTINSAGLVHHLVFAADAFAGAGALDNLGLPESGDGKSDLLQIAKWEADFLLKMQDEDGGFYFLVYPRDRRYEGDVLPDRGDPQIVWPKNSATTAAATAALAQAASSRRFREEFPEAAAKYLEAARRGWKFLRAAEERLGRDNTYRKFSHYGNEFKDADEITWAACELYLATGEEEYDREVIARLDPRSPEQRRWGWRRLTEGYGRAVRSYAFGAKTGRVPRTKLDRQLLMRCEEELITCAEEWVRASRDSAYGISFPEPTKRVVGGGWFFSTDQAFDIAVAAQLDFPIKNDPRPAFREAVIANLNYEAGTNPLSLCFITGLGWKRPLEIVHQYSQNDHRKLPLSGIPQGNIQEGFSWVGQYKSELGALSYPLDGAKDYAYPIYDRWGDSFNLQTEFVIVNSARALATAAWLMGTSPTKDQPWRAARAEIAGLPTGARPGKPTTLTLKLGDDVKGLDLAEARIVWEARDHEPRFGREFVFTPREAGAQWVEAEAQWPDGRRVFAVATFTADK